MRRCLLSVLILLIVTAPHALAQERLDGMYDEAYIAWDEGHYLHSLVLMTEILRAPDGDRFLERIALLTGELYHVTELSPDGQNIGISPDGSFASFEVREGGGIFTNILSFQGGTQRLCLWMNGPG